MEEGWTRKDYAERMGLQKSSASRKIIDGIDRGTIERVGSRQTISRAGAVIMVPTYRFTPKLTESLGCGSKTKAANR